MRNYQDDNMKKINAFVWLATMLMTFIAISASAIDSGSENQMMRVGETKTLYLPRDVTMKTMKLVNVCSTRTNCVEVVSRTNHSVTVRALKAIYAPVIVHCDYSYSIENGNNKRQSVGTYEFKIIVEEETINR